mmetsp:Transcript_159360/g.297223  ORF Transcript_159360/g.297223 Transcript_159360/m.297223 type:complete len:223 (+) Transcript_159360:29-697(+)
MLHQLFQRQQSCVGICPKMLPQPHPDGSIFYPRSHLFGSICCQHERHRQADSKIPLQRKLLQQWMLHDGSISRRRRMMTVLPMQIYLPLPHLCPRRLQCGLRAAHQLRCELKAAHQLQCGLKAAHQLPPCLEHGLHLGFHLMGMPMHMVLPVEREMKDRLLRFRRLPKRRTARRDRVGQVHIQAEAIVMSMFPRRALKRAPVQRPAEERPGRRGAHLSVPSV